MLFAITIIVSLNINVKKNIDSKYSKFFMSSSFVSFEIEKKLFLNNLYLIENFIFNALSSFLIFEMKRELFFQLFVRP